MNSQRGAAVRIRRLLGGLTASALFAGGLVSAAAPANAAVVITPTSTTVSVLAGATYQSLNIGATAVSGFGGSDVVLTTITASAGKVKISTVAGLSAVTGYPSGDWTAGASQIAFTGSQTNVNAALATLSYQNASLATSTVTISTVLGAGTEGGINYSTISYLPDTGRFYYADTRASVSWESAFCLSRYNFYASGNATPISNNAGFDYSNGSCSAKAGYSRQNRTFNGLIGYLATSTSATENQFIYDKVGQAAWIAGSDRVTEGTWQWMSGPEQGTTFWTSACGQGLKATCTATGQYNFWNSGEPNQAGEEDAILFVTSPAATWNDASTGNNQYYIVEFGGAPDSSTPAPSPSLSGASTISVTTVAAPTITTVTPTSGGTSGNTAVTITGTNFTNASAVTFGGVAATNYTVNSSTQIVAYTPTGSAGTVNVAVTTPGGGTATKTSAYTYLAPPTITGVSPSAGPTAGGTSITITGTGFTGATSVTVGGVAASFSVVSSTSIQAQTPARPVGSAAVSVTTGGGTATSGLSAYEYLAAPVISTILPNRGPTTGNTSVTITGSGFTGTTGVTFGGVPGSSVTVVSDTQVTVNSPSGSAGAVTIALTAPGGTASMPSAFTYQAAPVITAITPSTSAEAGGQSVILTGSNFTGATAVTFGGTAALSFSVDSDTKITAEVPPKGSMASTVDVAVTATGGTGTKTSAFTYVAGPSVASVSPTSGPTTGGTSVTITGTGMGNATSVEFDGVLGTIVSNTSTRIVVTTPATVAGAATVSVTNAFGTSGLNDAFTFQSQPTITSVSPSSGPTAGGTSVTITGTDFTGATAVRFGSTNATSFTVNSATSITAVTPVKAAGAVAVDVVTPGGTGTLAGGFTYRAAPTVTSVSPAAGVPGGGTSVTITGTGLASASAVTFGGVAATIVTTSDTSITATTPAGTGAVTVAVTTTGGSGSKASAYTYASAPTITGVSPASGPIAGGTSITLTGTNFTNASVVTIGGTAATSYSVVSATSITAVVPASTAGQKDIVVTTPGGTVTSVNAYQYFSTPTLTGVSPTSGLLTGGTSVTLTGTNFTGATAVTFGGTAAASFTVNSATSITAVTPARTAGVVTVAVTTPGGVASQSAAFTYAEAPTITSLSPASGSLAGGQTITITGTNLTGATAVSFGSNAATSVTVVNSTTVTVVSPGAGSAAAVNVTITTPGGTGTLPSGFFYVSAPTVSTVSPNLGGLVGGTTVTITGTNLAGATGVTFGGVAAAFSPVNATTITATTPASGASGAVDVVVTTTGGTATKINGFTYAGLPTIVAVTPTGGNVAGGTAVVITGTNFTGATSVIFGDTTATFSVINAGEISATSPARAAGTVKVEVVTSSGTASKADAFTYYGTPTVTSVTAATGPITGGTTVTITGTNFTGATGVTFGGTAATGVTVVSSRELTVVTPVKPAGPVTVAVTTPGGTGSKTAAFTYVSGPTVSSVTASSGPLDGGNEVTIAGSGFTGATAVTFGGVSATTFTVNSDVQIVATVPAGAAGAVAVAVTATGGTGSLPTGYSYVAAPTISSLSPAAGTTAGGTTVTITGTGLTGASAVTFGGAAGTTIKVVTANQITVVTPAGSAGVVDVALTAAGGTVSLVSGFTYVAPSTGGTSTSTSTTTTTTTSVAPNPIPPGSNAALPAAPGPDGSVLLVDGQARPVTVTRNSSTRTAEVVGTGFTMNMYGTSSGGTPLGFNTNGAMLIEANRLVKVAGTGFQPNSKVSIFIFSTARTLGTLTTNAQGAFDGSVGVPLDVLPGEHTVQVNGYTTSSQVRSLSLGVELKATGTTAKRIISFKGKSAKLTKVAKRRLAAFANQMSGRPTILVAGSAGQGRNNDTKLARQRVNVVTKYLRGLGVNGNYTTKPYSGDIVSGGQSGRKVTVTANW